MKTHAHKFKKGRSKNVETCACGKFRNIISEENPAIEAKTAKQGEAVEHTPGPWALKIGSADLREMSEIVKASDKIWRIAYAMREWSNTQQQAEDDANARLIAAAPELLEAAIYATCPKCDHNRCENLRRAIAKAEGRK
jgi:hypothetical protein